MFGDVLTDWAGNYLVLLVIFGLLLIWLLLSALIGVLTGWFALAAIYPDRPERAVARRTRAPAVMGGATLNGMLRIDVCASGLRFGMNRLVAPFAHNFLVPWSDLQVVQQKSWMPHPRTVLLLGQKQRKVTFSPEFIASLMREGVSVWPTALLLPFETDEQLARRLFKQWLVATVIATLLLTVAPTLLMDLPMDSGLLALGLAIPAVTIGFSYMITYFKYRSAH